MIAIGSDRDDQMRIVIKPANREIMLNMHQLNFHMPLIGVLTPVNKSYNSVLRMWTFRYPSPPISNSQRCRKEPVA